MGVKVFEKSLYLSAILVLLILSYSFSVMAIPTETSSTEQPAARPFRFVVLGDMHVGPGVDGLGQVNARAIERITRDINPAFVLQTGDLIDIGGDNSKSSEQTVQSMWDNVRTGVLEPLSSAGIMFFHSGGNHDGTFVPAFTSEISRRISGEVYSSQAARNRNYPISGNYGKAYSFNYGNSHFVSIFAPGTYGLAESDSQFAWLQSDLQQASSSQNIFTFAHSPIKAPALSSPEGRSEDQYLQRSRQVMSLLQSSHDKLHFSGHIHVSKEETIEGVRNLISGPLGGGRGTLRETGTQSNFAFTVVDVDGENIQYYRLEWPDFDASELPSAPAVSSPLPTPQVPESLSSIGVCPAGMRPAENMPGGIAPLLAVPPSGDTSASGILTAAHRYEGRQYGTGSGQFVCVNLVEQVLRDIGVQVSDEMHRKIFVIGSRSENDAVNSDDPIIRGVAGALTDAGIADSVTIDSAQPGDFVQYWWRTDSTWHGHSVIIERAKGNGVFDMYGAHSTREGVTVKRDVNLADPGTKAFIARLRVSSGGAAVASGSSPASQPASDRLTTDIDGVRVESGAIPESSSPVQESPSAPAASVPAVSAGTLTGCGSKIALVGDSLTACSTNYIRYLQELCGSSTTIMNDDGNSNTLCTSAVPDRFCLQPGEVGDPFAYVCKQTAQMKNDFSAVLAQNPQTVVILGGTNDLSSDFEAVRTNLLDMYRMAHARGMRVVALTLPPYKSAANREASALENLRRLNNWILTESPADVKVNIYNDLVTPGTDDANPGLFGRDLIHPNQQGKDVMARDVYAALMGAVPQPLPVPSASSEAPGSPGSPAPAAAPSGPQVNCVPESVLPRTLYDFLINSSMGMTTIIGIARQNIAIGINKTPSELGPGGICQPLTANMDYDIDYLKETYGRSQLEVESQLQYIYFMQDAGSGETNGNIRVHRLVAPAFRCVERAIKACPEGASYDFRTTDSWNWQGIADNPELLSTSSFGISIDINLDTNPSSQDGELITDLPQCVIDAFRRYGFKWGGDYPEAKSPAHFEFMADPNLITIQQGINCPEGTELVTIPSDSGEVSSIAEGAASVSSGASSLIGNSNFVWPIPEARSNWNSVVSCFGWRNLGGGNTYHDGIDVGVGTGTPTVAVGDGVVQRVCSVPSECLNCNIPQCTKFAQGRCSGGGCGSCDAAKCAVCSDRSRQCGGFGNNVLIKHADNLYSHYNHLNSIDPAMSNGAQVTKGQQVGTVGNTGVSQGAHLHFAFYNTPGARDTGDPQRPESGQNPFCFLPDAVLTRLNIQARNNCVNYGTPPSVSSTNSHLLEDCSYADLSALSGMTPTVATNVPPPSGAEVGGPTLVQVCRPSEGATAAGEQQAAGQPSGEGTVSATDMQCHYCGEGKRYVSQVAPDLAQSCLASATPCCSAPCPPGSVVKSGVPIIRQADEAAMGAGGDCWHDGVAPDRPEGSTAGESYRAAGCGVASMKMALGGYGISVSSQDLFCGTPQGSHTIFLVSGGGDTGGSSRPLMVNAAKGLGRSDATQSATINWESIVSNIRQGKVVIFHLGDRDKIGRNGVVQERCYTSVGHYIVLLGANDDFVIANDPGGHCAGGEERMVLSRAYVEGVGKGYVVV
jgi:hypothetical protein